MKRITAVIASVLLVAAIWCVGATQSSPAMPIAEILKSRGTPALVATGFDVKSDKVVEVSFYEVTSEKVPAKLTAADLRPGWCLVYTKDEIFDDCVKTHFDMMARPEEFSGSTMWSSIWQAGSPVEIITVGNDGRGVTAFKGNIHIAYFEAGAKGHLITKRVKIKGSDGK